MTSENIGLTPAQAAIIGASIGALVAAVGWYLSHRLTVIREIEAKRREQHLNFLVQTYRTLSKVKPYVEMHRLHEISADIQTALADVQFLGNVAQIAYAQEFAENVRNSRVFNLDPLLKLLRDELRASLGKEKIEGSIWWIAIRPPNYPPQG